MLHKFALLIDKDLWYVLHFNTLFKIDMELSIWLFNAQRTIFNYGPQFLLARFVIVSINKSNDFCVASPEAAISQAKDKKKGYTGLAAYAKSFRFLSNVKFLFLADVA